MNENEKFMKEAIKQAKKAAAIGDVPIGCVIVLDGKIIARAYNQRNKRKTTLAHAELLAIEKASKKTGDWRLEECTMYITLEPCQMCAGAIVQARIPKVVIGAMNPKADVQAPFSISFRGKNSTIRQRLNRESSEKNAAI